MMKSLEKLQIEDIEKLIIFADEVLNQCRYFITNYDEYGIALWERFEDEEQMLEVFRNRLKEDGELSILLNKLVKEKVDIERALADTAEEILVRLQPITGRILGMFRNGIDDMNYCVDDSVSDEYLLSLFAMRVRDLRILLAAQRDFGKEKQDVKNKDSGNM